MFKVKDLNGAEFELSIDDIQDINSDKYITTKNVPQKSESYKEIIPVVVDSEGKEIGTIRDYDISQIKDSEGEALPKALLVTLEATHSGDNQNWEIYHSDSMERDAASFMTPYKKPFLRNHDSYSEPLGRVEYAALQQSQIEPSRDAIVIDVKVTDSDAIQKFLDGRYNTVSIGGKAGTVQCGVCGKNILKDGVFDFCGHYRGQKYKDSIAKWHFKDITYRECSVVNHPADVFAQVLKIKVINDDSRVDDNNNDDNINNNNNIDDDSTGITIKDSQIADNIDDILNNDDNINNSNNVNNVNGDNDGQTENDDDIINNNNNNNNIDENDNDNNVNNNNKDDNEFEKEIERLKNELSEKEEAITSLTNNVTELTTSKEELESKVSTLENTINDNKTTIETLENELVDAKDSIKKEKTKTEEYRSISINLANNNKELLVEKALLSEQGVFLVSDNLTDRKNELLGMSAKEILNVINDNNQKIKKSSKHIAKVKNPGLIFNDKYTILDENQDDTSSTINDKDSTDKASNKSNILDTIINGLKS